MMLTQAKTFTGGSHMNQMKLDAAQQDSLERLKEAQQRVKQYEVDAAYVRAYRDGVAFEALEIDSVPLSLLAKAVGLAEADVQQAASRYEGLDSDGRQRMHQQFLEAYPEEAELARQEEAINEARARRGRAGGRV